MSGKNDNLSPNGAPTETQPSDVSRETSSSPGKNKPSSFYVYLAVLFGAAFLMLLLAYFVQRRNNETVQDNLRTTIASREELLEDIQRLEEENEELEIRLAVMEDQRNNAHRQIDELEQQLYAARNDPVIAEQKNRADVLTSFAILEQALRDKNYEIAAKRVRTLCQGDLKLDLGLVNLDGTEYFYPEARLAEIIPLLEKAGALAPGEVAVPGVAASDG